MCVQQCWMFKPCMSAYIVYSYYLSTHGWARLTMASDCPLHLRPNLIPRHSSGCHPSHS